MPEYLMGRVPPVAVGEAGLPTLSAFVAERRAQRVVLVVDRAVLGTDYVERVSAAIELPDSSIPRLVVPPVEPTESSIDAVIDAVRAAGHPVVIGIGGGSALDTAKQAAAAAAGTRGVGHYALAAHRLPGHLPLIAIPTTAGTGAEVTRTCIFSDVAGRKMWTWGEELLPDLVVLDPVVTVSVPPRVSAATGLDAFVHALEAATGRRSSALGSAHALAALRLVTTYLTAAVRDGSRLDARQAMQEAALLAGIAIDNGGTGMAHCIGHALGATAQLSHGVAVALGLHASLAWNIAGSSDAFTGAAHALGTPPAGVAERFEQLLWDTDFADALPVAPPPDLSPPVLAEAMIAAENLPMYTNNATIADDAERLMLAERTIDLWHELRARR